MVKWIYKRLEYSLSNALFTYELLNADEIREIYEDIQIQQNEENEIELGFKTKKIAKNMIDKNLSYDMNQYVYLDFRF